MFFGEIAVAGTAVVTQDSPKLNRGRVEGDLILIKGKNLTINGGHRIDGVLKVPGNPQVKLQGGTIGEYQIGTGLSTPTNYKVTLNGNSHVDILERCTENVVLPNFHPVPKPTGIKRISLSPGQSIQNFEQYAHVTLNQNYGDMHVPEGVYGNFTANCGSNFVIGQPGQTTEYTFKKLRFHSGSQLKVMGSVVIKIGRSLHFNCAVIGEMRHPEWLRFEVSRGNVHLNGGSKLYGHIDSPKGNVHLNANSLLVGSVFCKRFVLNGGSVIKCGPREAVATNQNPLALPANLNTLEDVAKAILLEASDPEEQPLQYTVTEQPVNGTLSGIAPNLSYTPNLNYSGPDQFKFKVSDGELESEVATVSLTVDPVNDEPVAKAQQVSLNEDSTLEITLTGVDDEGADLSYQIVNQPLNGVLTGSGSIYVYTPNANYNGLDHFQFRVSDGNSDSELADVNLEIVAVNDAPFAEDQQLQLLEDGSSVIVLEATDVDGDALAYSFEVEPEFGVIDIQGDDLVYIPNANFNGQDLIRYRVFDGNGGITDVDISLTVLAVNDAPSALSQSLSIDEDGQLAVILRGVDVDGDALSFSATQPQNGSISGSGMNWVYMPHQDYAGEDHINFIVTDSAGATSEGSVVITVNPINDDPVATSFQLSVEEDGEVEFELTGNDVDGDDLQFEVSQPEHGSVQSRGDQWVYLPDLNYYGSDSFVFEISDGAGGVSQGLVEIDISSVNDNPITSNQNLTVVEDSNLNIQLSGSDADGDALVFNFGQPSHGIVSGSDGALIYEPNPNYFGSDGFTYTVGDGQGGMVQGMIHIEISGVNDDPLASGQSLTVLEDDSIAVQLSGSDVDGDELSYLPSQPEHGTLTGSGTEWVYRPTADYTGEDSFVFTVSDGQGGNGEGLVSLNVSGVNDAPGAISQNLDVDEDKVLNILLTGVDVDGDELSFSIEQPENGVVHGAGAEWVYTPNADFTGTDRFQFTVSDGNGESSQALVSIVVAAINDAPVAQALSGSVGAGEVTLLSPVMSDVDSTDLAASIVSVPTQGVVEVMSDGGFKYTANAEAKGFDQFTYRAFDGELYSTPVKVFLQIDGALTVQITSPKTELNVREGESVSISILAKDQDDEIAIVELLAGSRKIGSFSGRAGTIEWLAEKKGVEALKARAVNAKGKIAFSSEIRIHVSGVNKAPIVSAGSDQRFVLSGDSSENLLVNGGAEMELVNGLIPGWTSASGDWIYGNSSLETFEVPAQEGEQYFSSTTAARSELYQDVDVSEWAESIDLGVKDFQFSGYLRSKPENNRLDIPRLLFEFRGSGVLLGAESIEVDPSSAQWSHVFKKLSVPIGTRTIRVRIVADYNDSDETNDAYFDGLKLIESRSKKLMLRGVYSDDDLPTPVRSVLKWEKLSGPECLVESPNSLLTNVYFEVPGTYVFKLSGFDGELSGEDDMTIIIDENGGNLAPVVDAGDRISGDFQIQPVQLSGVVSDDGLPSDGSLKSRWLKINGPGRVHFDDPEDPATGVSFQTPGIYELQLQATDGELFSSSTLVVDVPCVGDRQPIDLFVSVDWTRSMGSFLDDSSARIRALEASLQARNQLDPNTDRSVSIDMNANTLFSGYASNAQRGLAEAYDKFDNSMPYRDGAKRAIVIICDGYFLDEGRNNKDKIAAAKAAGIEIYIIAIANGVDAIQSERMKELVTSPLHYYELTEPSEIIGAMASLFNGQCGKLNNPPEVFAGASKFVDSVGTALTLDASYLDDAQPLGGDVTFQWDVVSGDPSAIQFSNPTALNTQVSSSVAGKYVLRLRVHDGDAVGQDTLELRVDTPCSSGSPEGLVAWWPFELSTRDEIGSRLLRSPRYYLGDSNYRLDNNGYGYQLNGEFLGRIYAKEEEVPEFDSEEGFSISFRTKATGNNDGISNLGGTPLFLGKFLDRTDPDQGSDNLISYLSFGVSDTKGLYISYRGTGFQSGLSVAKAAYGSENEHSDGYDQFTLTYDRSDGRIDVFVNGKKSASKSGIVLDDLDDMTDRLIVGSARDASSYFTGVIDDLAFFDRPLSANEAIDLYKTPLSKRCLPNANITPTVDAGEDFSLSAVTDTYHMDGYVTDDSDSFSFNWKKLSGPGDVTFADDEDLKTAVSFSVPGFYTLELCARDAFAEVNDVVEVRVGEECRAMIPQGAKLWVTGNGGLKDKITGKLGDWRQESFYQDGKVAQSLGFLGESNYAVFSDIEGGGSSLTMEGWFFFDSNTPDQRVVFSVADEVTGQTVYRIDTSHGGANWRVYYNYGDAAGRLKSLSFTTPNYEALDGWNHVSLTIDAEAQNVLCYFNGFVGDEDSHESVSNFQLPAVYDVYVGANPAGDRLGFLGEVDELTLYNRRLNVVEIQSIAQAGVHGKCSATINRAPVVDAGSEVSLEDDRHSLMLVGSASDDVGVTSVLWSKLSGPGDVSFVRADDLMSGVSFTLPGVYILKLEVGDGELLSSDTVRVNVGHLCETTLPSGTVGWWKGDAGTDDFIDGSGLIWNTEPNYVEGVVGKAFQFNNANGGVEVKNGQKFPANGVFTLETWVKLDEHASVSQRRFLLGWHNKVTNKTELGVILLRNLVFELDYLNDSGQETPASFRSFSIPEEEWVHFSLVSDGSSMHFYLNGVLKVSEPFVGGLGISEDAVLQLGGTEARNFYSGRAVQSGFSGAIDEPTLYNRVLSADELRAIYEAGSFGKCYSVDNLPPVVSVQDVLEIAAPNISAAVVAVASDEHVGDLTVTWEQIRGDQQLIFSDSNSLATQISAPKSGVYGARVTVSDGSFIAQDEVLINVSDPNCSIPTPYAWWTGERLEAETGKFTLQSSQEGELHGAGISGRGFNLSSRDTLTLSLGELFAPRSETGFTVEFWASSPSDTQGISFRLGSGSFYSWYGSLRMAFLGFSARDYEFSSGVTRTDGLEHVSLSFDTATSTLVVYRNGAITATYSGIDLNPESWGGNLILSNTGGVDRVVDDLTFYDQPLSAAQVQEIYSQGTVGKCVSSVTIVSENKAPRVSVRDIYSQVLGDGVVSLAAVVSDDGLPVNSSLTYLWSQLGGPVAGVEISDGSVLNPELTFSEAGNYEFQLMVSDGDKVTLSDTVRVRVFSDSNNGAPVVNAGDDLVGEIGGEVTIRGSVSDEGLPAVGVLSYGWVQVDGPSAVVIEDADQLALRMIPEVAGRFVFELRASDGELESFDRMSVVVSNAINRRPVVDAGADLLAVLPVGSIELAGVASDDGLPDGGALTTTWIQLSGPEFVRLEDLGGGKAKFDVGLAGDYVFVFRASDGVYQAEDSMTLQVSGVLPENQAPVVSLGDDLVLGATSTAILPVVSDDGYPRGELAYRWSVVSGPGGASFTGLTVDGAQGVEFSQAGVYEVELVVDDGELIGRDVVRVTLADSLFPSELNELPVVFGDSERVLVHPVSAFDMSLSLTDDGVNVLTYAWSQVSGPGVASFSDAAVLEPRITLPVVGDYVFELVIGDGGEEVQFVSTARLLPPGNGPPVVDAGVDQTANEFDVVSLSASSGEAGLVYTWEQISGPVGVIAEISAANAATTNVQLGTAGSYLFRVTGRNDFFSASDVVLVEVLGNAVVDFRSPVDGDVVTDATLVQFVADVYRDGMGVSKVEFYEGDRLVGAGSADAGTVTYVLETSSLGLGEHTVKTVATFSNGDVVSSGEVTFSVVDFDEAALVLEISDPVEGQVVSGRYSLRGTAFSDYLSRWALEVRELGGEWRSVHVSDVGVIDGELVEFDPSLLRNGVYDLRLAGVTSVGTAGYSGERRVVIEGDLKVGHFALAFEDLSIPVKGLPLSVTRTYDSRFDGVGDFGRGWQLGVKGVEVLKSRDLEEGWDMQVVELGGLLNAFYSVMESVNRKRVSVRFPDGRMEVFEASIRAFGVQDTNLIGQLPENAVFFQAVSGGEIVFKPVNGALGRLEIANGGNFGSFGVRGVQDIMIDGGEPTLFRYTEEDGTSYLVDVNAGLQMLTDRDGNTLSVLEGGLVHSAGESVLFTRDGAGRISEVVDPSGAKIVYAYDEGRLVSVTNRVGDVTTMRYENAAFPGYLTEILDGRGLRAIRSEFDDDGRMVRQLDAEGNTVVFEHDLANNREVVRDRLGNVTVHEYDDFGNVVRTTDALGGVTVRGYDALDNEVSMVTPEGVATSRTFDGKRNVTSEVDGLGNVTRYGFDERSQPLSIEDALGRVTGFSYDGAGSLASMRDALGNVTGFGYSEGNLSSLTDAAGVVTGFSHDAKGRELTMVVRDAGGAVLRSEAYAYDERGNRVSSTTTRTKQDGSVETLVTGFVFDAEDRVVRTTLPDGSTTEVVYNEIGKQSVTRDQLGRETEFVYDSRGNLIKTVFHDLTFSSSVYDVEGRMVASTNREGVTTYLVYDALGRNVGTILPDDSMPADVLDSVADILASAELADNPRTLTEFDGDGRVVASVDVLGNRTVFGYDGAGRRTLVRDGLGNETVSSYDAVGSQVSVRDALGRVTEFRYDDGGRLVETVFADGTTTEVGYDVLGRRVSATDQEGVVTRFEYDNLGRMVAVVDAEGGRSEYGFNERGDLLVQRDALGRETKYSYDVLGRRVGRTLPEGQSESVAYNVLGNMISRTDFNGFTTSYTYTVNDRVASVVGDSDHPSMVLDHAAARFEYRYDLVDRRVGAVVKNSAGTVIYEEDFAYDVRGRMVGHGSSNGDLAYSYDAGSNLTGVSSNTGYAMNYGFDALNRVSSATVPNDVASLASYGYNGVGSLSSVVYGNGVSHEYGYSVLNRLLDVNVGRAGGGTIMPQLGFAYTLNKAGHRTEVSELGGRSLVFDYDKLYRLKNEAITGSVDGVDGSVAYTLDAVGNRLSRTTTGISLSEVLPSQSFAYTRNDLLSNHQHDVNGSTVGSNSDDVTSDVVTDTDVYDFRGKLVRRTKADGTVVDCWYAADGARVRKFVRNEAGVFVKNVRYLVCSNNHTGYAQVLEERDDAGSLLERYLYGHDLVARESSVGLRSFYSYDGHGSVRGVTGSNGLVEEEFDYDAFGVLLGAREWDDVSGQMVGVAEPLRDGYFYSGERWDSDLGMYYLRARYLNAGSGRFHTMDDYEGRRGEPLTLHKYFYGNGNPVSYVDPSGRFSVSEMTAVISTRLASVYSGAAALAANTYVYLSAAVFRFGYSHMSSAASWLNRIGPANFNRTTRGWLQRPNVQPFTNSWRNGSKGAYAHFFKKALDPVQLSRFSSISQRLGVPNFRLGSQGFVRFTREAQRISNLQADGVRVIKASRGSEVMTFVRTVGSKGPIVSQSQGVLVLMRNGKIVTFREAVAQTVFSFK